MVGTTVHTPYMAWGSALVALNGPSGSDHGAATSQSAQSARESGKDHLAHYMLFTNCAPAAQWF